jgi:hypothetical protein
MYGHTPLSERELIFPEDEKPDVFYIGTGHQGALPITRQAQQILKKIRNHHSAHTRGNREDRSRAPETCRTDSLHMLERAGRSGTQISLMLASLPENC